MVLKILFSLSLAFSPLCIIIHFKIRNGSSQYTRGTWSSRLLFDLPVDLIYGSFPTSALGAKCTPDYRSSTQINFCGVIIIQVKTLIWKEIAREIFFPVYFNFLRP